MVEFIVLIGISGAFIALMHFLVVVYVTKSEVPLSLSLPRPTIHGRNRESRPFKAAIKKDQISDINKLHSAPFESAFYLDKPNVLAMKTFRDRVEGSAKLEIKS
ncbi:MAG: hypothetical protein P8I13_07135 [Porticoccaceae bacterium]|nr:hypothetical protein [Porticoccaceae bacterium]